MQLLLPTTPTACHYCIFLTFGFRSCAAPTHFPGLDRARLRQYECGEAPFRSQEDAGLPATDCQNLRLWAVFEWTVICQRSKVV